MFSCRLSAASVDSSNSTTLNLREELPLLIANTFMVVAAPSSRPPEGMVEPMAPIDTQSSIGNGATLKTGTVAGKAKRVDRTAKENEKAKAATHRRRSYPLSRRARAARCDLVFVHNRFQVTAAYHLLIEQPLRPFEERGLSFCQQPFHALVLVIDDTAHFAVDLAGRLLRVVAFLLRRLDLHQSGLAFTIECDGPKLVAHPVGLDHALGDICRLDQVVLRPRGGLA